MSFPHEARLVVNSSMDTAAEAAEVLLNWISNEIEDVHVEVYGENFKLYAMVECAKNDKGEWKAVDVNVVN